MTAVLRRRLYEAEQLLNPRRAPLTEADRATLTRANELQRDHPEWEFSQCIVAAVEESI